MCMYVCVWGEKRKKKKRRDMSIFEKNKKMMKRNVL